MGDELRLVVPRNDLHQALGAHDALGDGVEARLDRDDGQHHQRIEPDFTRGAVGRPHHPLGGLCRDQEAPRQVLHEDRLRGIARHLGEGFFRQAAQCLIVGLRRVGLVGRKRQESRSRDGGKGERKGSMGQAMEESQGAPPGREGW